MISIHAEDHRCAMCERFAPLSLFSGEVCLMCADRSRRRASRSPGNSAGPATLFGAGETTRGGASNNRRVR